ncbi:MAG: diacylglycerol kinase [Kiritimatiellae bacterium]|nr:diacylglycerol kinase [Kiritimatiellia bacterium]
MSETQNVVSQKPALAGMPHCFAALKYSLHGFLACLREEAAFRQECVLGIPHFIMLSLIEMDAWIRVQLGTLWFLLIAVELLNSGIEAVVDLASPKHHELARKAKDCGSAAVMCLLVLIVGCWIFALGVFR